MEKMRALRAAIKKGIASGIANLAFPRASARSTDYQRRAPDVHTFAAEAENDLDLIADYTIRNWGTNQADEYLARMKTA